MNRYGQFDDLLEPDWKERSKELQEEYDRLISDAADLEKELDLSNSRNLKQSKEIGQCIDLIDRLRSRVSDEEWEECRDENQKKFEKIQAELEEETNG